MNLPQVKVGDLVTVKYYESLAVEVIKPGATLQGQAKKPLSSGRNPARCPGEWLPGNPR